MSPSMSSIPLEPPCCREWRRREHPRRHELDGLTQLCFLGMLREFGVDHAEIVTDGVALLDIE